MRGLLVPPTPFAEFDELRTRFAAPTTSGSSATTVPGRFPVEKKKEAVAIKATAA